MADIDRIGVEKLGDTNYATWSIQMKSVLIARQLWAAIRDDPPQPAAGQPADAPPPVHAQSEEAQAMICLHVGKQHLRAIADCPSARAAWEMLRRTHAAQSLARQMTLRDELRRSKKSDSESVGQFVARVLELRGALADAGDVVDDRDVTSALMAGLPPAYFQLVTTLKYRGGELTVQDLVTNLQQFEQDLLRAGGDGPPQRQAARAYATGGPHRGPPPSDRGAQQNRGGRSRDRASKARLQCHYCKKFGHFAAECRKRMEDERRGGAGPSSASRNPAAAYTAVSGASAFGGGDWVLDSGATEHITGDRARLGDLTPVSRTVHGFGGGAMEATGVGSAVVYTKHAPEGILMREVLFVPGAPGSLLSTSKVDQGGGRIVQQSGRMQIVHGKRTLAVIERGQDGLYRLPSSSGSAVALYTKPVETA